MSKDFRGKFNAYKRKRKIPDNLLDFWHRNDLSKREAKERYWIDIFTKPTDFEYLKDATVWYTKIWIWDTQEEKWLTQITTGSGYYSGKAIINYEHELILFHSGSTLAVYSFHNEMPLGVYKIEPYSSMDQTTFCVLNKTTVIVAGADAIQEIDIATHTAHIYFIKGRDVGEGNILRHVTKNVTVIIRLDHKDSMTGYEILVFVKQIINYKSLEATNVLTGQHMVKYSPAATMMSECKIPSNVKIALNEGNHALQIGAYISIPAKHLS